MPLLCIVFSLLMRSVLHRCVTADDGSNYSSSDNDDETSQRDGYDSGEEPKAPIRSSQSAAAKPKPKPPARAPPASASFAASQPDVPSTAGRKRKKPAAAASSIASPVSSVSTLSLSFSQGAPLSLSQSASFDDDDGGFTPIIVSHSAEGVETLRALRTRKKRIDYAAMDPKLEKAIAAGARMRK